MSIKGFHLIFIVIAALFCAGFGVWALFFESAEAAGEAIKAFGVVGFVAAATLLVYGVYFYRKSKSIIV
ncbi:hypothetical protein N9230_00985 [Akkermansiaceae bacterium]|jgi:hypothetical protein|nr:hypothetical protein [Akkermansiaceae bacterium]